MYIRIDAIKKFIFCKKLTKKFTDYIAFLLRNKNSANTLYSIRL